MKRVIYSFIFAITLLFMPIHVFAADGVSVDKTTITIEQGKSATIKMTATNVAVHVKYSISDSSIISLNDVPDWIDSEPGASLSKTIKINGLKAGESTITFNTTVATYDEVEYPKTMQVVVKVLPPKSSNANLSGINIDGKELSNFSANTTTYTLSNTDASSIKIDVSAADSKAKVSGTGTKKLSYGLNTINLVVTAENGSKKTYTIKITRNDTRSSENRLTSLTTSPEKIDFNSDKTNYNINVENNVTEIKIEAKTKDSKATITGTGTKKLNVYTNTYNIVVTAENGSKKTYTIRVNRKDELGNLGELSKDNTLKSLVVEGYDIKFDTKKENYYLDVPKKVDKVNITAKSTDSKAIVTINNPETLELGENTITIDVTAEDGTIKTYKIIINRDNEIPKTTIDNLINTIDETDSDTIIVEIKDDNNIITKEMLEKIKSSNKKLIINKYQNDKLIYTWELIGEDIKEANDINTLIELYSSSDKKINELTDYSRYLYLKNNLDTSIFNNILLKIYIEDKYSDEKIYVYNYDNKNLTEKNNGVKNSDTYLEISNLEKGNYVITQKEIKNCIYKVIAIVEFIVIIALIILTTLFIIIPNNKKIKKHKKQKKH